MRALAGPDRGRGVHDAAPRRDPAADRGHPGRLPASSSPPCTWCPRRARRRSTSSCPGILALAVMSTAMVSLGIATGFERGYGVLKRLGADAAGPAPPARRQDRHHRGGRGRPGRRADRRGLRPRLEPGSARLGLRPAAAPSAPSCWPPSPSAASGSSWPGCSRPRSTWPRPTGSISCCCCWAAWSSPSPSCPAGWPRWPSSCRPRRSPPRLHATLGTGPPVPTQSWVVLAVWAVAAPAGGGRQLPLGMSFFSSAVNLATRDARRARWR